MPSSKPIRRGLWTIEVDIGVYPIVADLPVIELPVQACGSIASISIGTDRSTSDGNLWPHADIKLRGMILPGTFHITVYIDSLVFGLLKL